MANPHPDFRPRWRPKDARLIRLIGEGRTPAQVAAELDCTPNAAIQRAAALRARGVTVPRFKRSARSCAHVTAPDLLPLIERAIASDPAGAHPPRVGRKAWPVHLAAYIAHVELGFPMRAVAPSIGRCRKLVSYAARQIEDRRDEDLALDGFIERLAEQARGYMAEPRRVAA